MVELVDTRDLKSLAEKRAGSSPAPGTIFFYGVGREFQTFYLLKHFEAAVAQLVEHHVANVNVTSSSLVSRSNLSSVFKISFYIFLI